MVVEIGYHEEFKRQIKQLLKKYPSMRNDFANFLAEIEQNPLQGVDLGNGVRKLRMAITSKGKGKSGGARVITYNVQQTDECLIVTLLTIYDKNEIANISDAFIKALIATI